MFLQKQILVETQGRNTYELTRQIQNEVGQSGFDIGLCHLFIQHTSSSLMITENADSTVQTDILNYFENVVKDGDPAYLHNYEGDDDMAAHIRCLLTQTELTIPIRHSTLQLGTWQGIYLFEHRYHAMQRKIIITLQGEKREY